MCLNYFFTYWAQVSDYFNAIKLIKKKHDIIKIQFFLWTLFICKCDTSRDTRWTNWYFMQWRILRLRYLGGDTFVWQGAHYDHTQRDCWIREILKSKYEIKCIFRDPIFHTGISPYHIHETKTLGWFLIDWLTASKGKQSPNWLSF